MKVKGEMDTMVAQVTTVHISRQRYEFILSLGYRLRHDLTYYTDLGSVHVGDVLFHVLSSERSVCEVCGYECDSVDVNTPAELEAWRIHTTEEAAKIAIRDMRQGDALTAKKYWTEREPTAPPSDSGSSTAGREVIDKNFPKATIECPHYIAVTFGDEDICSMCGGRRLAIKAAIKTCDHGVSLSDPCRECGNTMPKPSWVEWLRSCIK